MSGEEARPDAESGQVEDRYDEDYMYPHDADDFVPSGDWSGKYGGC